MKTKAVAPILTFVIVLAVAASSLSQQPEASRDEIKALIEKLASQNPKPTLRSGPDLKFPPSYDRKKQGSVFEARQKLKSLGTRAFHQLIESWGDDRYSLTYSVGINGYMENATVGDVAQAIVFDQIQPYGFWPRRDDDPRGLPLRPRYPSAFLGNKKSALQWL